MDENQDELFQRIEKNNVKLQARLRDQFETYKENTNLLTDTNERCRQAQSEVQQVREEVQTRINRSEEEVINRLKRIQQETKYNQTSQETKIAEINADLGRVSGMLLINRDSIEEIKHQGSRFYP